ncbi:MAG: DegT/DnrJ/EryC1/StrS family aminotransferase [Mangrovibacterium sp.]
MKNKLAILGGNRAVTIKEKDAFTWPQFKEEEYRAVKRVMSMPNYTFYEEAYLLEQEIKRNLGTSYALPQINGTSSIHSALFALGIKPGDEVIVPSFTYWATVMPVLLCNATPVFAESDPNTLNIDPEDIERKVTPETKALIVVHLCGLPCEMDEIMRIARKYKLKVVEDCAHCDDAEYKGRKIGTIGDISCFSYQATKLIPGIEGGMMVTNNREYYERAVALGHYERLPGLPEDSNYKKYQHTGFGYKYRIHPLAAAIIRQQLKKHVQLNKQREENLKYLNQELDKIKGLETIKTPDYMIRNFYCYRIKYEPEELGEIEIVKFIAALQAEGLEIGKERYVLMHQQPVFKENNAKCPWFRKMKVIPDPISLPITEKLYERLLSLPTFPQASKKLVKQYIEGFKKVVENADELKRIKTATITDNPDMDWSKMQMPVIR